jgi:hypothetical protein
VGVGVDVAVVATDIGAVVGGTVNGVDVGGLGDVSVREVRCRFFGVSSSSSR